MQKGLKIKLGVLMVVGLLFFIFLVLVFVSGKRDEKPEPVPLEKRTVTPVQNPTIVTPTPVFQQSATPTIPAKEFTTGVLPDELEDYLNKHPEVEIISELRRSMPLQTENFSMDYSYKDAVFVVEIKPPYAAGRDAFLKFLAERGIVSVDSKLFSISYK